MYMFLMHERYLYFVSIYVCGIYLSHYIDIDTGEGQRHRDKLILGISVHQRSCL